MSRGTATAPSLDPARRQVYSPSVRLTRYLKASLVQLDLQTTPPDPIPETLSRARLVETIKEGVLREIVELLDRTGKVANPSKLLVDLMNRERKSSTAVGNGLAIPHVRTMQAREFAMAFARSRRGLDFDAPDGRPVHLFICCVAPPYDDRVYTQVYKRLGQVFGRPATFRELLEAHDEHEVVRILSRFDED